MKIGMVGCGALGTFYGAKLHRDAQDVHFLLRSDYQVVRRRGVRVLSPEGDFHVQPRPARNPQEIGVCDLVLVALKTTANDQFERLIPPLVGPSTAILTLQNGLGNETQLAELFGAQKIMGGLCFVCLNRIAPGVIEHLAHGRIVLGEYQGWPEPRTHDVASMFRHAGVPCKVTDSLERTHWEKLAWNIPFNGLGVASVAGYDALMDGQLAESSSLGPCLTTDQLLHDPRWARLVRELMIEVITIANALGLSVSETVVEKQIEATRKMRAYKASTLVDYERGQPLEMEGLFLKPLRAAKKAGVPSPRLEALCEILTKLNPA
ncbi:MAG: 2-dehydropantoate 2-reductase [Verrucomicrobiota bacterium]